MVDNSCLFRQSVLTRLERLSAGHLSVRDRSGSFSFGSNTSGFSGQIDVHNRRFYRSLVLGGSLGAAESYIRGDWDAADLTTTMRVLARNVPVLTGFEQGLTRILRPLRYAANLLRRNSPAQSKRNIAAHYDLSNDFFALMLDPTMTYSSGIFPTQDSTMEQASLEKYERICQQLELKPTDQLLEIGTGWGGFAEYAAQNYGCRVTTTTISQQQYEYAQNRFESAGLTDKITLLNVDYRDLTGKYDKLASIEMIEAVGEQYLRQYFAKCCQLLKSTGKLALQAITIPDYRYDDYRRSVDFIQPTSSRAGSSPATPLSATLFATRPTSGLSIQKTSPNTTLRLSRAGGPSSGIISRRSAHLASTSGSYEPGTTTSATARQDSANAKSGFPNSPLLVLVPASATNEGRAELNSRRGSKHPTPHNSTGSETGCRI